MNVGMVGVGCISGIYLENFANTFKDVMAHYFFNQVL